jgi:hypothetical protein
MHRHGAIPVVCETYAAQVPGIRPGDRCLSAAKAFFATSRPRQSRMRDNRILPRARTSRARAGEAGKIESRPPLDRTGQANAL